MVYDHYHFIELAVVISCQPRLTLMNNFTAYSIVDHLIVYIKEKHYGLHVICYFILCLEKSVCPRERFWMHKHESQDEF